MMTTTTQKSALDFTREILASMPGWHLDANTERMIAEKDSGHHHWAGIVSDDYPGAEVSINTSHRDGKLSISASYPRGWEPYIEGGRGRAYRESIGVGMSKTGAQIAKDIYRRLFNETGYLARVGECLERKRQHDAGQADGAALAGRLAAIVGAQTQADRGRAYGPGASHLVTEQNDRKFSVWPSTSGSRAEVDVSHGGTSVSIEFHDLSPAFAERVLREWWADRQSHTAEGEDR